MSYSSARRSLWNKLLRRSGRILYSTRRAVGLLPIKRGRADARLGVYVAHYDASRIYRTHLESFRRNTEGPFNYYVMKNCSNQSESAAFDRAVSEYGFPVVFESWPRLDPLSHGASLQRLVEMTTDEVVVLCDVDAFPIAHGWDQMILEELGKKDVVAIVAHFPVRTYLPVFLHPSFMAFRRSYFLQHGLDLLPAKGCDPGFRVTEHMIRSGTFDLQHVTPLFPTSHEVEIPREQKDTYCFGRTGLLHGFGTTYSDLIFHYWFTRHIRDLAPIYNDDGRLVVTSADIQAVIDRINARYGPA